MTREKAIALIDRYFAVDYSMVPDEEIGELDAAIDMMVDAFNRPTAHEEQVRAAYDEGFRTAVEEMRRHLERRQKTDGQSV